MKLDKTEYLQSSKKTLETAQFIYSALVSSTSDPAEAAEVLSAVLVWLWLSSAKEGADIDTMLSSLCRGIKLNVENNQARKQ